MNTFDALFKALKNLEPYSDVVFKQPKKLHTPYATEFIEDICHQSKIRFREIALKDNWWKSEGDPMLIFWGADRRPAAAFCRGGTWYFHPYDENNPRPLEKELIPEIFPTAFFFYSTPNFTRGYWNIFLMLLRGNASLFSKYFLLGLIGALLGLFAPFIYKALFDQIIPNSDFGTLLLILLALLGIAVSTFAIQAVTSLMMLRFEGLTQYRLNIAIWDQFLRLPMLFFRKYSSGDLIQRSKLVDDIRTSLSVNVIGALAGAFFALLYIIPMLYFSWQLTIIGIVSLGISFLITYNFLKYRVIIERQLLALSAEINQYLIQLVQGLAKIRVAGAETRAFQHWFSKFSQSQELNFQLGKRFNAVGIATTAISMLSLIVIYGTVIYLLENNIDPNFTIGTFMAFNAAFVPFSAAIGGFFGIAMTLVNIIPTWERAKVIFENKPENNIGTGYIKSLKGAVETRELSFRYPTDKQLLLNKINIEAKPGESIGIAGPSGSGKSTILRLLIGFEDPVSGLILYDGENLEHLDKESLRRQCGVVLQTSGIMAGTVYENIVFGRNCSLAQVKKAITYSCLDEILNDLPLGLDTILAGDGGTLSGGQKQRILLARALVTEPKILFLDEATSALDNTTQDRVQGYLDELKITQIVVAHRLSTLRRATRIYVVEKGNIVEQGTYQELKDKGGLFSHFVAHQEL